MAIAAFESLVRSHQWKPSRIVVESGNIPRRPAVAFIAVSAQGAFVGVGVAAGTIPAGLLEGLPVVALGARKVLMEREEILRGVLELDV